MIVVAATVTTLVIVVLLIVTIIVLLVRTFPATTCNCPICPTYPTCLAVGPQLMDDGADGADRDDRNDRDDRDDDDLYRQQRDRRVLIDPMYPPFSNNQTTAQPSNLSHHLIGYLSNADVDNRDIGGNTWKLFARQQAGRQVGSFYIIPSDNTQDVKIVLDNDIVVGRTLRDVYTIPDTLSFTSPLLLRSPYTVVRLPTSDMYISR